MNDWSEEAAAAVHTADQARFESLLKRLNVTQLSALADTLRTENEEHGAFDQLLHRAGAAMCDAEAKRRVSTGYCADGEYTG